MHTSGRDDTGPIHNDNAQFNNKLLPELLNEYGRLRPLAEAFEGFRRTQKEVRSGCQAAFKTWIAESTTSFDVQ